jgi:hypothetical protein
MPASTALADQTSSPRNVGISGSWLGTNYGFENGIYKDTPVRYTVTKVDGISLTGTKQWQMSNGQWSDPEMFQGVLYKSGAFHAVDNDGYLIGELVSPTKIRATYLESGEDQAALVTVLTKASRGSTN